MTVAPGSSLPLWTRIPPGPPSPIIEYPMPATACQVIELSKEVKGAGKIKRR